MMLHKPHAFEQSLISRFLTVEQIAASPAVSAGDEAMGKMACFVARRLAARDSDLGRAGPVCPFARQGVATGGIRFTDFAAGPDDVAEITAFMHEVRDCFVEWGQNSDIPDMLRALVVTFSGLGPDDGARIIERVQKTLKASYVKRGLMVGQFFPGCEEPGIRNPDFRPLDAPVIALAIRYMVPSDAPFLIDLPEYRDAYLSRFGAEGHEQLAMAEGVRMACPR